MNLLNLISAPKLSPGLGTGLGLLLSLTLIAEVRGSSFVCKSCLSCNDEQDAGGIFDSIINNLGTTDGVENKIVGEWDSIAVAQSALGGECPDNSTDPVNTLAPRIAGTGCFTLYFSVPEAQTLNTFSCTMLGPLDRLFVTLEETNMTQADYVSMVNGVGGDLWSEVVGAEQEASGAADTCSSPSSCNYLPTNDVATLKAQLGVWNDDYSDPTSTLAQNTEAAGQVICSKAKETSNAMKSCSSEVQQEASSGARAKRSAAVAVMVFTMEMQPQTGFEETSYQAVYTTALSGAQGDSEGDVLGVLTNFPAEVSVSIQVGGGSVASHATPKCARAITLIALVLLGFAV